MTPDLIQSIQNYAPAAPALDVFRSVKTVVLTGITAAGKNTIMRHLLETGEYQEIVTTTTRSPRENNGIMEQDGREYYFIDFPTVADLIDQKQYLEVKKVHDNVYGTLISEFQKAHDDQKIAISDIDVQGADELLSFDSEELYVLFVVPPSFDVWFERLKGRYSDGLQGKREDIAARFKSAQGEIAHALKNPAFIPVMNIDSAQTAAQIQRIVHKGKLPSQQERDYANTCLRQLQHGLENYIALLSD